MKGHFKTDGLTSTQHDALETRVRDLMSTPSSTLLAKYWYLLSEDFHLLGKGPAAIRQVGVASMESALGAAIKHAAGKLVPGSHPYLLSFLHIPHRFTRRLGRPCIHQPIPTNDAADHPPHTTPTTETEFTSSLQRFLQMICRSRMGALTQLCGDIRRQRQDTDSCIYTKDWRVK